MNQKKLFILLGVWFSISLILPLLYGGLADESITRFLILGYFLLGIRWFYKKGQFVQIQNPKKFFILWCTVNASIVEIFHMISKPLHTSLLITSDTTFAQGLQNTIIDLLLTTPAYIFIFIVIWQFAKRYNYSPFSFLFLMGLGQALGDGNAFFIINPAALIFLPYVMLNYWTMNFIPYLVVRKTLPENPTPHSKFKKYILPVIVLPLTYLIAGGIVFTIGGILGWIPK